MSSVVATAREAPLGVLMIAALFVMIGFGSMAGGVYLMLTTGSLTLWAVGIALVAGPSILYLTYHLVRLAPWTWSVLVALVALLFLSSLLRVAVSPAFEVSPLAEIVAELALAFYLTRPNIRAAFARSARAGSDLMGSS